MTAQLGSLLDVKDILRKKGQIRRTLMEGRTEGEGTPAKIAIMAGSTIGEIKGILELFLLNEKLEPEFYESQFDRHYEESVFPNPALESFQPGIVYIHTTVRNITHFPTASDSDAVVEEKLDAEISRLREMWTGLRARHGCVIIQNNFELPDHRFLGNLDASNLRGRTSFVLRLNERIAEYARENASFFFVNDLNYLSASLGLGRWFDKNLWYQYRYALSHDAMPLLAHSVASIVKSVFGKSKKCLVLDLDNTLWGGVIGDDGVDGVRMGAGDPIGEAYRDFQAYAKELKARGVLLAVCSKNEDDTAKSGFAHADAVLGMDDFSAFKASWGPKDRSIVAIAEELNIGLDSLVFIDDNPAEREIVRRNVPSVTVPEVGEDITSFIDALERGSHFEPVGLSQEDTQRTEYYRANREREVLAGSAGNYDDYLRELDMVAEITEFSPASIERVVQLINKTNQFNLTTRRCTLPEAQEWTESDRYVTLGGKLSDKFGPNGLITAMVGEIVEDELVVMIWVMSCRVFGRTMEHAMFDALVGACRTRGIERILGNYLPTKRNGLVADLYGRLGLDLLSEQDGDSSWKFEIPADYQPMNSAIQCT